VTTALLVSGTLALALGGCGESPSPEGFRCDEPSVDFGRVWEGAVLEHDFVFFVVGTEPHVIEHVRADCGCTLADLQVETGAGAERVPYEEGAELPPGSRVHLGVSYHTRGKRGETPRTITLYTDVGTVSVVVSAAVVPLLVAEPEGIDLGILRDREERRAELTVRSEDGRAFALRATARGIPPQVVVTPRAAGGESSGAGERAREWRVDLRFAPGMPRGPHLYSIELESDLRHADKSPVRLSPWVTVQVVGAVGLRPPVADFGAVPAEEMVARTLRLEGHDGRPLAEPACSLRPAREADAALAELAEITTRAVPGENAWDIQILLPALEGRLQGTFLGSLVVETGHPDEPRIEAGVRGLALQAAAGRTADRQGTGGPGYTTEPRSDS